MAKAVQVKAVSGRLMFLYVDFGIRDLWFVEQIHEAQSVLANPEPRIPNAACLRRREEIRSRGLARIRTDQNKRLIHANPRSSVAAGKFLAASYGEGWGFPGLGTWSTGPKSLAPGFMMPCR